MHDVFTRFSPDIDRDPLTNLTRPFTFAQSSLSTSMARVAAKEAARPSRWVLSVAFSGALWNESTCPAC